LQPLVQSVVADERDAPWHGWKPRPCPLNPSPWVTIIAMAMVGTRTSCH